MADSDILSALKPVVVALDEMGVAYEIGGSVASSACGVPRTTLDVDLVADLRRDQVKEFVGRLQSLYYVDENAAFDAVNGPCESVPGKKTSPPAFARSGGCPAGVP